MVNKKYTFTTTHRQLLLDTDTAISIYLKLRDHTSESLFMGCNDFRNVQNAHSYICLDSIATLEIDADRVVKTTYPGNKKPSTKTFGDKTLAEELEQFIDNFEYKSADFNYNFATNGFFGYSAYDSVKLHDDRLQVTTEIKEDKKIPLIRYDVYKYVIVLDHFKSQLHIFEHDPEGLEQPLSTQLTLDKIESLISSPIPQVQPFELTSTEQSNLTDQEYENIVQKGIEHCLKGDVFQIVLSREFQRTFKGDDFNVFRALRSLNPSPYLFYFDYIDFRLFGSSPEIQLLIDGDLAYIEPIAGTYRRTGDPKQDKILEEKLLQDPKELSEHVMLVDLARNDLSTVGKDTKIEALNQIKYYSHVIHIVSRVSTTIKKEHKIEASVNTFPAGTLTGAPKRMAMELIDRHETVARSFYGGQVGFYSFEKDCNHAIVIRSLLSKDNKIFYQAGAGVVAHSNLESERKEVYNKLSAIKAAIEKAVQL